MRSYTLAVALLILCLAVVFYYSREVTRLEVTNSGRPSESSKYRVVVNGRSRDEAIRRMVTATENPNLYEGKIAEGEVLSPARFRNATLQDHPYYNPFGYNRLKSEPGWTLAVRNRPSWRAARAEWDRNPMFRIATTLLFFAATLIAYSSRAHSTSWPSIFVLFVCVTLGLIWALAAELRISLSIIVAFAVFTVLSCCGRDSIAIGAAVGGLSLLTVSMRTGNPTWELTLCTTLVGCVAGSIVSLAFERDVAKGGITM